MGRGGECICFIASHGWFSKRLFLRKLSQTFHCDRGTLIFNHLGADMATQQVTLTTSEYLAGKNKGDGYDTVLVLWYFCHADPKSCDCIICPSVYLHSWKHKQFEMCFKHIVGIQ